MALRQSVKNIMPKYHFSYLTTIEADNSSEIFDVGL